MAEEEQSGAQQLANTLDESSALTSRGTGLLWPAVRERLRQAGVEDPDQYRDRYNQFRELEGARRDVRNAPEARGLGRVNDLFGQHSIPFFSPGLRFTRELAAARAQERFDNGQATREDMLAIARRENEERLARDRNWGEEVGVGLAGLPAIVGEMYLGGQALRGLGMAASAAGSRIPGGARALGWAGRAGQALQPNPMTSGYGGMAANAARFVGRQVGTAAITTPLTPSMYLPQWVEQNRREGRTDPLNYRGLAQSYTLGVMQGAVLNSIGQFANASGPAGGGILAQAGGVANRTVRRTVAGLAEQAAVDTVAHAMGLQEGRGLVDDIMNGNLNQFARHAAQQSITFAAFSAIHEIGDRGGHQRNAALMYRQHQRLYREGINQGLSPEQAARRITAVQERFASEPSLNREQAMELARQYQDDGQRQYAESLARLYPEAGQERQVSVNDLAGRPMEPAENRTEPVPEQARPATEGVQQVAERPAPEAQRPARPEEAMPVERPVQTETRPEAQGRPAEPLRPAEAAQGQPERVLTPEEQVVQQRRQRAEEIFRIRSRADEPGIDTNEAAVLRGQAATLAREYVSEIATGRGLKPKELHVITERLAGRTLEEIASDKEVAKGTGRLSREGVRKIQERAAAKLQLSEDVQQILKNENLIAKEIKRRESQAAGVESEARGARQKSKPLTEAQLAQREMEKSAELLIKLNDELAKAKTEEKINKITEKIAKVVEQSKEIQKQLDRMSESGKVLFHGAETLAHTASTPYEFPAPGKEKYGLGAHDVTQRLNERFNVSEYKDKVPGKERAAAILPTDQTVTEASQIANVPTRIEEVTHILMNRHGFETEPAKLPTSVADGLREFYSAVAGRPVPLDKTTMAEGLAVYANRRTFNDLTNLTPNQEAAAAYVEKWIEKSGLKPGYDATRADVRSWLALDAMSRGQTLVDPTGSGVNIYSDTWAQNAYSWFIDRHGVIERFDNKVHELQKNAGLPETQKGRDLLPMFLGLHYSNEHMVSDMKANGLLMYDLGPNGERIPRRITGPVTELIRGIKPEELQTEGTGVMQRLRERLNLSAVGKKESLLGTFLTARSVLSEFEIGQYEYMNEMTKPPGLRDPIIMERATARMNAVSPEQLGEFRRFMEEIQKNPDQYQRFVNASDRFTAYFNDINKALATLGEITVNQHAANVKNHPVYVPHDRIMDTGDSSGIASRQRTGGAGRKIVSPFVSLERRIADLAQSTKEHLINESLWNAGNLGGPYRGVGGFWREIPSHTQPKETRVELFKKFVANGMDPVLAGNIIDSWGGEAYDNNVRVEAPWKEGRPNVRIIRINGKPHALEFQSAALYNLLYSPSPLNHPMWQTTTYILRKFTDGLKFGATTINSAFQVRNIPKDFFRFMQTEPGSPLENIMKYAEGMYGAYKNKGKRLLGGQVEHAYQAFESSGGAEHGAYSFLPSGLGESNIASRELRGLSETTGTKVIHSINKGKQLLEFIGSGEQGPRFAAWLRAAKELGWSRERINQFLEANPGTQLPLDVQMYANNEAAKSTTDFRRTGSVVSAWNQITPFFGAHMAAMTQEARSWTDAFKEIKQGKVGPNAQRMFGSLAVGMSLTALAHYLFRDQDWYKELSSFQRHNWWVLGKDSKGQLWGVPKPQGPMGFALAGFQEALRATDNTAPRPEMLAETAGRNLVPNILPVGVSQAWEIGSNRNWAGGSIVPRQQERANTSWENFYQYQLPYALEQLTGGAFGARTAWGMTPAPDPNQSTAGRFFDSATARLNPVRGFMVSTQTPHQSVNDYFETYNQISAQRTIARQRMQPFPREAEYQRMQAVKPQIDRLSGELQGMVTLSDGSRRVREMPSQDRRREIMMRMTELSRRGLGR